MDIITYDEINNYNINKNIIDKLIFNNFNYYKNNNQIYFLLSVPILLKNNKIDNINITPFIFFEKGITNNKTINSIIPDIILNKEIIIFNINNNNIIFIKNNIINNNINNNNIYKNILNYLIDYSINIQSNLGIFSNILYYIKKKITKVNFKNSYNIIEYIDKLLIYIIFYKNIIKQIDNIVNLFPKNNELNIILINKNKNNLNDLIIFTDSLNNSRHATMQRIAYLETGFARLLKNVATIFLPLSFIIAFFTMPFKKMPLQKSNNGFIIIIIILSIVFIISISILYKDIFFVLKTKY